MVAPHLILGYWTEILNCCYKNILYSTNNHTLNRNPSSISGPSVGEGLDMLTTKQLNAKG